MATYAGFVSLTSTDALVPSLGAQTFAGDNGVFTFSGAGVVQDTAGVQTLTASDGTLTATTSITVQPTAAPVITLPAAIGFANEAAFAVAGTSVARLQGLVITLTISDEYIHAPIVATGTVNGLGNWSIIGLNLSSLNDGAITYTVTSPPSGANTGTASGSKDTVAPATAVVTAPSNGSSFNASTIPANFDGAVADNAGGAGLNGTSTTFTLQSTSGLNSGLYWNGSSWQPTAFNLAAINPTTTGGTVTSWTSKPRRCRSGPPSPTAPTQSRPRSPTRRAMPLRAGRHQLHPGRRKCPSPLP